MAVDEYAGAKCRAGLGNQIFQRFMVGLVATFDAFAHLREGELARVYLRAIGDHPCDRAEPGSHPGRVLVDEGRERFDEHRRIELIRLAVWVHEGARKQCLQQRRTMMWCLGEQFVDERIFGSADGMCIEFGGGEECLGVGPSAMGRREDQRNTLLGGRENLNRGG